MCFESLECGNAVNVDKISDNRCHLKVLQGVVEAGEGAVGAVVIPDWMDKHLLLEPMFDYKICVNLKNLTYGMPALLAYVMVKFADSYGHRLSFLVF